ncbi:hypothetical protein [Fontivita pretiosa]|uniref:hypothetical protein n=1 Tax=Fontivita pretiosa TaxID=2989684 RepID=UPI003D187086
MLRRPGTSDFRTPRTAGTIFKRTVRTLLSAEQLNQAIMRESARVDRRGGGTLSLVLFRLPSTGGRGRKRRMSISAVRLARTILQRIRVTDDVGWFDDQHLGVLLPDTPPAGAWRLAQEVCHVVARRGPRPLCTMYTYPARRSSEPHDVEPTVVRTSEMQLDRRVEQASAIKVAS